jgi:hypothetical protein
MGREHSSSSLATWLIRLLTGKHRINRASLGPQQFGRRAHIVHAGVQPQIVAVWIEDYGHSVVDGQGQPDWPKTFTLVATPGQPILVFVAQQLAAAEEETPSGHWARSTLPAARVDGRGFSTCMTVC